MTPRAVTVTVTVIINRIPLRLSCKVNGLYQIILNFNEFPSFSHFSHSISKQFRWYRYKPLQFQQQVKLNRNLFPCRTISVFRDSQLNSFYVYPSEWKGRLVKSFMICYIMA